MWQNGVYISQMRLARWLRVHFAFLTGEIVVYFAPSIGKISLMHRTRLTDALTCRPFLSLVQAINEIDLYFADRVGEIGVLYISSSVLPVSTYNHFQGCVHCPTVQVQQHGFYKWFLTPSTLVSVSTHSISICNSNIQRKTRFSFK